MIDVLERILIYKREEVRERRAAKPSAQLEAEARAQTPPRGFLRTLQARAAEHGIALVAEVKKASPSRGLIRADFDPAAIAAAYEEGGAACLSVLTDGPSFQGDDSYLRQARNACALPCLRKDFTIDPYQITEARALGADAVLIIMAAVNDTLAKELLSAAEGYGLDVLVEVHNVGELDRAAALHARFIGINNRSLRSFETSLEVTEALAAFAPKDAFLVSESGIFTSEDVARVRRCGARAVLVGESLMRQDDVAEATRALLAPCG